MSSAPPRLKRRRDFLRAAGRGRKAAAPGLVLQAVACDDGGAGLRCGFTVSKRVGNAVVRNRVRRRLRAIAAEVLPTRAAAGFDYVLIGRAATADRSYDALRRDLIAALSRLKLCQNAERPATGALRERS
jgi:ribonuclease P protein component